MRTICKLTLLTSALFFTLHLFSQVAIPAGLVVRGVGALIGGNKEKKQEKTIDKSSSNTKVDGKNVTILRVKDSDIKSKAKAPIIQMQNQLDEYAALVKANAHLSIPKKDSGIYKIQMLDSDWPVEYYETELKAYKKYELKLEQHEKDSITIANSAAGAKKATDSLALVKTPVIDSPKTASKATTYSYINKAYAIVKATPAEDAKTLGVLYVGSYIKALGAVDKTVFVKISVNGADGYIDKSSLVDNIDKISVPNADIATYKKGVYYKYVPKPN